MEKGVPNTKNTKLDRRMTTTDLLCVFVPLERMRQRTLSPFKGGHEFVQGNPRLTDGATECADGE